MCPRCWLARSLLAAALLVPSALPAELELHDTAWAEAAHREGIAPALLYALALVESRRTLETGRVGPWPWVIRTPTGSYWFDSRERAEEGLRAVIEKWPGWAVDVGLAQVNLGWHAERFDDPLRLLDADYNLRIAAAILADAISSTRDPVVGIGRYHNWASDERTRGYGERVWQTYRELTLGPFDADADSDSASGGTGRLRVALPGEAD